MNLPSLDLRAGSVAQALQGQMPSQAAHDLNNTKAIKGKTEFDPNSTKEVIRRISSKIQTNHER